MCVKSVCVSSNACPFFSFLPSLPSSLPSPSFSHLLPSLLPSFLHLLCKRKRLCAQCACAEERSARDDMRRGMRAQQRCEVPRAKRERCSERKARSVMRVEVARSARRERSSVYRQQAKRKRAAARGERVSAQKDEMRGDEAMFRVWSSSFLLLPKPPCDERRKAQR